MDCLVIGIDGADYRIFEKFKLKFLNSFIDENCPLDLKEDLWSRGWVEILNGLHGKESGAFYAKPRLDGSHLTTSKFNSEDHKLLNDRALWEKLNKNKISTGLMNIPTSGPAQKVDGFIISGAGGGSASDGLNKVPSSSCYPEYLSNHLNDMNYILDVRFSKSGIKTHKVFIERLIQMQEKRIDCFISLMKKKELDFGFIAIMSLVRSQNIYIKHIENMSDDLEYDSDSIEGLLQKLYSNLDICLNKLINELNPKHIIFTSDHGTTPKKYISNLNIWLLENGFAKKKEKKMNNVLNIIKGLTPLAIRQMIGKRSTALKDYLSPVNLDWSKTNAFAVRYIPGIYLNDKDRFNGFKTIEEHNKALKEIIEKFNQSELNKKYGMFAEEYRSQNKNASHEKLLPDIWIHHPEYIFPEASGNQAVQENKNYKFLDSLENVKQDMFAGTKAVKPFVVASKSLEGYLCDIKNKDLTAVYYLIMKSFGIT
jgi:predicted AlkP superfamily phosphohydrolase/phosphomutase